MQRTASVKGTATGLRAAESIEETLHQCCQSRREGFCVSVGLGREF